MEYWASENATPVFDWYYCLIVCHSTCISTHKHFESCGQYHANTYITNRVKKLYVIDITMMLHTYCVIFVDLKIGSQALFKDIQWNVGVAFWLVQYFTTPCKHFCTIFGLLRICYLMCCTTSGTKNKRCSICVRPLHVVEIGGLSECYTRYVLRAIAGNSLLIPQSSDYG